MWFIYSLISGFAAALTAFLIHEKLRHTDALLSTTLFCAMMTAMLLLSMLCLRRYEGIIRLTSYDFLFLMLVGMCCAVGYIAYFFALQGGPMGGVVAIDRLSILYVVLISAMLIQRKPHLWVFLGALCMIFGSYIISKYS